MTKKNRMVYYEAMTFLLIVFSGVYLKDIWIQPIYIIFVLVVLYTFFAKRFFFVYTKSSLLILVFTIYLLLTQNNSTSSLINVIFSLLYFVLTYWLVSALEVEKVIKYVDCHTIVMAILFVCDAVWRFLHPVGTNIYIGKAAFYRYKFSSIMYNDSNFVAFSIVCLFFFLTFLEKETQKTYRWQKCILLFSCVLSFSRAAILVIFLFSFLFSTKIKKTMKIALICSFGFILLFYVVSYVMNDDGFSYRIMIIKKTIDFFHNEATGFQKLFGIGLGKTVDYLDIGSHVLYVTYIMETGLIGFALISTIWLAMLVESYKKARFVLLPFFVAGISFTPHYLPYMYCYIAIIMSFVKRENGVKV